MTAATMRAVVCRAWGTPEDLTVEDVAVPTAGPGEVRIAVAAAGVNFADTLLIAGKYQEKPDFPFTPGMEIAGEVVECGAGVEGFAPGDRVMAGVGIGGFAEQAVAKADDVIAMPDAMSYPQAAGFSVTYGTAHIALGHRAKLAAGETLLVLGAAGGVGLATVEVGKAMGATVIAAASDADKLALAAAHGADHLIDYRADDMRARVKEITQGAGCDVIFDPVGGDAFDTALRCIAWEGRILAVGFASGRIPKAPANILLVKNCAVVGVYWGAYRRRDPALFRASFDELFAWFGQGKLKPHVSNSYALEAVGAALNTLIARKATGKVVLTPGGG